MSRRTTKCLTWGEMRRSGSPLVDENGRRVGMIDFAEYVTLCGKPDEDLGNLLAVIYGDGGHYVEEHHKPRACAPPVGRSSAPT